MRTLVIHPNDPSTQFLRRFYNVDSPDFTVMDERNSNSEIRNALNSDEFQRVMMLGHGYEYGLLSPQCYGSTRMFERDIISPQHVEFLRRLECIGIWCNANIFADRYDLHGLFSGMVISELSEAQDWHILVADENEVLTHREQWADDLSVCLRDNWTSLSQVPESMLQRMPQHPSHLEEFNYESVYWF